jgi:hypothetical protein
VDVETGVVGPQEPARVADRGRTEPGAGPVGDAAVERDTEDGDVADVDVLAPGQPGEGGGARETGDDERIDRADGASLRPGESLAAKAS